MGHRNMSSMPRYQHLLEATQMETNCASDVEQSRKHRKVVTGILKDIDRIVHDKVSFDYCTVITPPVPPHMVTDGV